MLLAALLVLFAAVRGFERQVGQFSQSYFPAFARQVTTKAVTEAVEEVLQGGAINRLKNSVVAAAEQKAEEIHNSVMYIPLGAFSGLTLIANEGPKIPLTYCLTGSFSAELVSSFESAGINQTVHHIRLVVKAEIVTASVDYKDTLCFSTDYEVAQSVIVGGIPSSYGSGCLSVR